MYFLRQYSVGDSETFFFRRVLSFINNLDSVVAIRLGSSISAKRIGRIV